MHMYIYIYNVYMCVLEALPGAGRAPGGGPGAAAREAVRLRAKDYTRNCNNCFPFDTAAEHT